jgi:hypothetical protein
VSNGGTWAASMSRPAGRLGAGASPPIASAAKIDSPASPAATPSPTPENAATMRHRRVSGLTLEEEIATIWLPSSSGGPTVGPLVR